VILNSIHTAVILRRRSDKKCASMNNLINDIFECLMCWTVAIRKKSRHAPTSFTQLRNTNISSDKFKCTIVKNAASAWTMGILPRSAKAAAGTN